MISSRTTRWQVPRSAATLKVLQRFGLQLYPTLLAEATPKGKVTDKAFETMTAELVRRLKAAPVFTRSDRRFWSPRGALLPGRPTNPLRPA